jgi:hypothetical protein
MAAQVGFSGVTVSAACPAGAGGDRLLPAGGPMASPAGRAGSAAAGELDVVGLSWTSWDLIEKVRRADQAHSKVTDARRTGRGFHPAGNGEMPGQRPFRWFGMGGL